MKHYGIVLGLLGLVVSGSAVPWEEREDEPFITLVLDWAMNWGSWGPQEFCPTGTFAYAFQIKVESEDASDDTSMNGIELFCREPVDVGREGRPPRKEAREYSITSNYQKWGEWRGKRECPTGFLTGLKMKSEEDQGMLVDDTAANDLEMQCDFSTVTLNGGGNSWGYYSNWANCPEGYAICGIETKVEGETASDDTALNNVMMFCCSTVALKQPRV